MILCCLYKKNKRRKDNLCIMPEENAVMSYNENGQYPFSKEIRGERNVIRCFIQEIQA